MLITRYNVVFTDEQNRSGVTVCGQQKTNCENFRKCFDFQIVAVTLSKFIQRNEPDRFKLADSKELHINLQITRSINTSTYIYHNKFTKIYIHDIK
jgi:phosphate starvation-inducible protein PhoH